MRGEDLNKIYRVVPEIILQKGANLKIARKLTVREVMSQISNLNAVQTFERETNNKKVLSKRHTWRFYTPIASNLIASENRKRFSPPIDEDTLGDFLSPIAAMWQF